MSTSSTYDLQTALYGALTGAAGLVALMSTRWYDHVPQSAQFPYGEFGEFQEEDDSALDIDGSKVYVTLHVWDRPGTVGRGSIQRIVDLIRQTLDEATLTMADHHTVSLSFEGARYLKDPDGLTVHAVITIVALTEAD